MSDTATKKICLTGGHITPAIAVIDEIRNRHPQWDIVVIGRTSAQEGQVGDSYEPQLMREKGVRFLPLVTGRLQRIVSPVAIVSLAKVPVGCIQALWYCWREKPKAIVSFGGYVALPVVLAGALLGIPIVTHEQTHVPGLANRIIALLATRVCVTFQSTGAMFPANKTVWTGLPLRKELFGRVQNPSSIQMISKKPLLYITGGSTGATSLNDLLFSVIPELIGRYTIVHQTGKVSYKRATELKNTLPPRVAAAYIVGDYFDARTVSWILQNAVLVIGRSGANTVVELAILHKRAILIPLPWSGAGEQMRNAVWLTQLGQSEILPQHEATAPNLLAAIERLVRAKDVPTSHRQEVTIHRRAAGRMVFEIERVLG